MINKEELKKISIESGLLLHQQEKDYLLTLFLYNYYKKFENAYFKGGTCIKYLYSIDRFSEDLDFNIKDPNNFKIEVESVLKEISKIGIKNSFIKEELFENSYTCEIGFEGPLFNGNSQTKNRFRIDAGYRTGTLKKPEWKLIKSKYPESEETFLVFCMNIDEIFVEKILALLNRKKGRHLYDVLFLNKLGLSIDKSLLAKKSKIENIKLELYKIVDKREYERDMSRLSSRLIPYEQVKKEVESLLEKFV